MNEPTTSERPGLDAHQILEQLPHRPPMLLVDRVLEVVPGERLEAIKTVSASEPALRGHFPGRPIYPGVMIIESMAQAGALLVQATEPFDPARQPLSLLGVDRARFRRPVVPGDVLRLTCRIASHRGNVWRLKVSAAVDGEPAAEAVLLASVGEGLP